LFNNPQRKLPQQKPHNFQLSVNTSTFQNTTIRSTIFVPIAKVRRGRHDGIIHGRQLKSRAVVSTSEVNFIQRFKRIRQYIQKWRGHGTQVSRQAPP